MSQDEDFDFLEQDPLLSQDVKVENNNKFDWKKWVYNFANNALMLICVAYSFAGFYILFSYNDQKDPIYITTTKKNRVTDSFENSNKPMLQFCIILNATCMAGFSFYFLAFWAPKIEKWVIWKNIVFCSCVLEVLLALVEFWIIMGTGGVAWHFQQIYMYRLHLWIHFVLPVWIIGISLGLIILGFVCYTCFVIDYSTVFNESVQEPSDVELKNIRV